MSSGRTFARVITLAVIATVLTGLTLGQSASAAPAARPVVVNGDLGVASQFPFLVALLSADRVQKEGAFQAQFCGGTLTTPTTVVTAAHCVVDQKTGSIQGPSEILIGIGPTLRGDDLRLLKVTQVTPSPDYKRSSAANDVAVLTLAEPVTDIPYLQPISVEEAANATASGSGVRVAGWGNTSTSGKTFPDAFRVGNLVIFPDASCGAGAPFTIGGYTFKGFGSSDADARVMLCAAGLTNDGRVIDSCNGDSGGPLVAGDGDGARLVGIVSWGEDCAIDLPGVYTRVASQLDFLIANKAIAVPKPGPTDIPAVAPTLSATPQSARIVVGFVAGDAAPITAFAATVVDPATGQVWNCFAEPRRDGTPSYCAVDGLVNGTSYDVTGIAGNANGNSPVAGPIPVTPAAVPVVGRITKASTANRGTTAFRVSRTDANGSTLVSTRVVCTPVDGGARRGAPVKAGRAVITAMRSVRYSCVLRAQNEVGIAESLPIIVTPRR
jgi:secreted trypsin-like serine protease